MDEIVKAGGYDRTGTNSSLATPRASTNVNVYGLSVDVFVLGFQRDNLAF